MVKDLTGYGNDGEVHGAEYDESLENWPYEVLKFDGTPESYVHVPNNGLLDTKYSISIVVNVKPEIIQTGPLVTFDVNTLGLSLWQYENK